MQKSQKKEKRKKNFLWDVFPCAFFFISGDKKGGKRKWFCFFLRKGIGKI